MSIQLNNKDRMRSYASIFSCRSFALLLKTYDLDFRTKS